MWLWSKSVPICNIVCIAPLSLSIVNENSLLYNEVPVDLVPFYSYSCLCPCPDHDLCHFPSGTSPWPLLRNYRCASGVFLMNLGHPFHLDDLPIAQRIVDIRGYLRVGSKGWICVVGARSDGVGRIIDPPPSPTGQNSAFYHQVAPLSHLGLLLCAVLLAFYYVLPHQTNHHPHSHFAPWPFFPSAPYLFSFPASLH